MNKIKTRTIILTIISILALFLAIISITYAYNNFVVKKENAATGEGGCFQVTYSGTELSSNSILSTIDYKESTYSTVTLSKDASCKIYSYANIYLHTNDTTTAPISTKQALKYKVLTGDGYERNGIITSTNDTLLASVPLTTTATNYIIYLWVDSDLSDGTYHDTSYSGYIYATSTQSSTITTDITPPSLFLYKESYIEGFNDWNLATGHTVQNNVLTMSQSGTTYSNYYNVNGEYWYLTFDFYTETASTNYTPNGGIHFGSTYYDDNNNPTTSKENYNSNGFSQGATLNTWKSLTWNASWANRYGPNVKKVLLNFNAGSNYSQPITKIRNFKIHGQVNGSSYDITVRAEDNVSITSTKYAKGNYDASYFTNNGTNVTNNKVTVTENGTYTFYVRDASGNENTTTIDITNIK